MQDLKDVTNNVHYENFRYGKLADVSTTDGNVSDGSRFVTLDPPSDFIESCHYIHAL